MEMLLSHLHKFGYTGIQTLDVSSTVYEKSWVVFLDLMVGNGDDENVFPIGCHMINEE